MLEVAPPLTPGPPEVLPPDWPLADASHTAAVSPYRWHVAVTGDGPDMLLIHGAGASAHSWGGLTPLLARTHRIIAPDLPGHGFTRARGMRAGLEAMTTDLRRLLESIGAQPQAIVGHSAGGALALSLALHLKPAPRVVVLNGALENFQGLAGIMFPIMARMMALNPLAAPFLARSAAGNAGAVARVIGATGTTLSPEALDRYRQLIGDRRHVSGTLAMMAAWSLTALSRKLPEIDAPTLFLHGAGDEAVRPEVARRAASAMPEARLEVIDGLGHLIHEEAPEAIAAHIGRFLS